MGGADADASPPTGTCARSFESLDLDTITRESRRLCDGCREAQVFGCAVYLRIGWAYHEVCATCARKLLDDLTRIQASKP